MEQLAPGFPEAFRAIEALREDRLPPGAAIPGPVVRGAERLTFVREGALAFQRPGGGRPVLVRAGELQHLVPGEGHDRRDANPSRTDWTHVVQLWLRTPTASLAPLQEHRRFSAAERRGGLCLVASPDARAGSLRIGISALVFSALLDPGQHLAHPLAPGRSAWLHVVQGGVSLTHLRLDAGDGAGFTEEHAVSLVAREVTELLLLDLGPPLPPAA